MADESPKQSFWTTLPGILTGMAAVLTAAGGIILGLHQSGTLGSKESHREATSTVSEPAAGTSSLPGSTTPPANAQPAIAQPEAAPAKNAPASSTDLMITEKDGTVLPVYMENLNFAGNSHGVTLTTGQSIDFGKIKSIDVSGDDGRINFRITLTGGEVLTGNAEVPSSAIIGQNRLGSVYAPLKNIRRITFPN